MVLIATAEPTEDVAEYTDPTWMVLPGGETFVIILGKREASMTRVDLSRMRRWIRQFVTELRAAEFNEDEISLLLQSVRGTIAQIRRRLDGVV
jgi:hypothetical protein